MKQVNRIVYNTFALYVKIGIVAITTLISTRLLLQILGVSNFGLYNLIAGTIALLSFLNASLMMSMQRFLSLYLGKKDEQGLITIFNSGLTIHFIIAILVALLLCAVKPVFFTFIFQIPGEIYNSALIVYDIINISIVITILTIPYNAAINAREEMWFFAIVEAIASICKLLAVYLLTVFPYNPLILYSIFMLGVLMFSSLVKYIWCILRYPETKFHWHQVKNRKFIKEQVGFVGWNALGALAIVGRNQGVAIVLNSFWGTAINAAYGIANQINSLVLTMASTTTTVFAPSIIRSKGENNNEKMLFIASFSSKIYAYIAMLIGLPILLNLESILDFWLGIYPKETPSFCQMIILTFIVLQMYPGITRCLYAEGNIRNYQIISSVTLLLNIPIGILLFISDFSSDYILLSMLVLQIITMLETVYFAKIKVGLMAWGFLRQVVLLIFVFALSYFIGKLFVFVIDNRLCQLIISMLFSVTVFAFFFCILCLKTSERKMFLNVIVNKIRSKK